ncbi:MAG: tetratricopeptide repeat protein [Methyloceanibacter sp.]|nr:tetratricopeptide repeat protein [Methyloceanibacter sp.]
MTKFIRCIEGHVYDADLNDACPVCGAIPGVEESGRVPVDALEDKEPKSSTKDKVRALLSKAGSEDGKKSAMFGVPRLWLVAGVALLLIVAVAIFGLNQGDAPQTLAQNDSVEAGPLKDGDTSVEDEIQEEGIRQETDAEETTPADGDKAEPGDTRESPTNESLTDAQDEREADKETGKKAEDAEKETSSDEKADEARAKQEEFAALRKRAMEHFRNRDFDSAVADFTEIIRQGGGTWDDYGSRGMTYHTMKDYDLALADFDRALEFDDHNELVHYGRALILRTRGDLDGAIAELDAAIDDHGSQISGHYLDRAELYVLKLRFDEAITDNDTAIELLSKDKSASAGSKAYAYFSRALNKQKKIHADPEIKKDQKRCKDLSSDKVAEDTDCRAEIALLVPLLDLEAAVAIDPKYAQAHAEIGWIAAELGNYQRAVEANTKAIKLDPTYSVAYSNRCLAYNNLKQGDLAMADCNDAIRHAPQSARAWTLRGLIYASRRGRSNRNKAISDLRQALKISPGYPDALLVLKTMGVKP